MKPFGKPLIAWGLVIAGVACIAVPTAPTAAASGTAVSTAGAGPSGQLGNGTNTALSKSHATISPATLANKTIQEISVGEQHGCVLTSEAIRNVYCWGENNYGQVGDGSTSDRNEPVLVKSGTGLLQSGPATALATGREHTCVLVAQTAGPRSGFNEVMCWGFQTALGRGSASTGTNTYPGLLNPLPASGATDIDTNSGSTCIVLTSGQLNCWGNNESGQLGNSSTDFGYSIVSVLMSGALSGKTPTDIEVGGSMSCVLTSETTNNLYCWGLSGGTASLGNGVAGGSTVPVAIPLGGAKFVKLDIGTGHACGITGDNRLLCWGDNIDNHLGRAGAPTAVTTPTEISVSGAMGTLPLAGVATGNANTCVWSTTGRLVCFGLTKGHFGVDPSTVAGAADLGLGTYVVRTPTAITGGSLATNGVRDFSMHDFYTSGAIVSTLTADETASNSSRTTSTTAPATSSTAASASTSSSTSSSTSVSPTTTTPSLKIITAKLALVKGARRLSVTTSQKVKVYQISFGRKRTSVSPKKFGAAVVRRTIAIRLTGTVWVRVQSGTTWSPWVRAK